MNTSISLLPRIDKSLFYHLDMRTFIYADDLAAGTQNFVSFPLKNIRTFDAGFITTQNFFFTIFFILPKFAFACRASDRQHILESLGRFPIKVGNRCFTFNLFEKKRNS